MSFDPTMTALNDERRKCLADSDGIIDRCRREGNRGLTVDEEATFNRLHARAAEIYKKLEPARSRNGTAPTEAVQRALAGPLEVCEAFRGRPITIDAARPEAERMGKDYANAFAKFLKAGPASPGGIAAGLQTDLGNEGGYLAPPQFAAELVKELDTQFWFRTLARVLPPTAAPKVVRPRRTSVADAFVWGTELAVPTVDTGFHFGQFVQTPHYMTGEFEVSADMLRAAPDADAILQDEIASRAGDLEETAFLQGNGIGKPLGLFFPSASGIDADRDVTGAINAIDTFIDTRLSLQAPYLRSDSLCWLMHRNALKVLSKLKSTTGESVWEPAENPSDRDHLYGTPIELSEKAPTGSGVAGAYTSGDYFAMIGDLSRYDIQDGLTLSVMRLTDSRYSRRGMVGFIVRRKVDGAPRDPQAFARLKVA